MIKLVHEFLDIVCVLLFNSWLHECFYLVYGITQNVLPFSSVLIDSQVIDVIMNFFDILTKTLEFLNLQFKNQLRRLLVYFLDILQHKTDWKSIQDFDDIRFACLKLWQTFKFILVELKKIALIFLPLIETLF